MCAPEEIVSALDALDPGTIPTETTVRGYKVKVTRQTMSPEEVASRRQTVVEVIAKTLARNKAAG